MNNPLIYIDPEGNIPISFITGGIGGIWSGGSKIVSNIMNGKDWHEGVAGATIEGAITGFLDTSDNPYTLLAIILLSLSNSNIISNPSYTYFILLLFSFFSILFPSQILRLEIY